VLVAFKWYWSHDFWVTADYLLISIVFISCFSYLNAKLEFGMVKMCETNFHCEYIRLACMSHWISYFRTYNLAVVIKMA
jgi:hypothetical protein